MKKKFEDDQKNWEEKSKKERKALLQTIRYLKTQNGSRLLIPNGGNLKEDKNMKFIVKQDENTLISATLPCFVHYILDINLTDYYIFAFGLILHHQLFIKSDDLLEAILMKWRDKNGERDNKSAIKESLR